MLRRWGIPIVLVALAGCGGGDGSARQDALADALATDAGGDLDDEQASCVATDVLDLIGEDELDELDDDPEAIADAELDDIGLDAGGDDGEDSEDVADVFAGCEVDLDDIEVEDLAGLGGDLVGLALHADYVEGLEEVLERSDELDDLDRGERSCLARAVALGAGLEALAEAGSPRDVADVDDVAEIDLDAARAIDEITDEAETCDVDLRPLAEPVLDELAFGGFGDVDCLTDALEPSTVDRLAITALVLGDEEALFDPEPIGDLIEEISDVLIDCGPSFEDDLELPEFDDEEYIDAVQEALSSDPGHPLVVPASACTAREWVDLLGEGFLLEEAGLFPEDLTDLDDYGDLFLLDEEAEALVEAAGSCDVVVADLALALLDTQPVTPEQSGCFVAVMADPVVAGDFVVGHLTAELEIDDPASLAVAGALSGCGIAS